MTMQHFCAVSALVIASASLAGCASGTQPSATNALPLSNVSQVTPMDGQNCDGSEGVKVAPCRLTFDAKHPGPKEVVVSSGDNDRLAIKERDDCAARNVATVTRMSNHRYVVTAGSARGTCVANFVAGMQNDDHGHRGADLTVVNVP